MTAWKPIETAPREFDRPLLLRGIYRQYGRPDCIAIVNAKRDKQSGKKWVLARGMYYPQVQWTEWTEIPE